MAMRLTVPAMRRNRPFRSLETHTRLRVLLVGFAAVGLVAFGAVSARAGTPGRFVFRAAASGDVTSAIPADINSIACSPRALCVAVGDPTSVVTSTDPSYGWRVSSVQSPTLQNAQLVSCPSDTLCVAVGGRGVDTSTDPAGGASTWTQKTSVVASGSFTGISCPVTTLCVAVTSDGQVVSSSDPADGTAATWTTVGLGGQLAGVSCASATACVAVGQPTTSSSGLVYSSTTPTSTSAAAWNQTAVSAAVQGISCPSTSFCIGYENTGSGSSATGGVTTSTNPFAAAPVWSAAVTLVSGGSIDSLSCGSPTQCVEVDSLEEVYASTNPGGGASNWALDITVTGGGTGLVTCVPTRFCVLGGGGEIWTNTDPLLEDANWFQANIVLSLYGVSCPSVSFCAAVDDIGNVLTSTDPRTTHGGLKYCVTSDFCVISHHTGHALTSPPANRWQVTKATDAALMSIACPNTALCVATDVSGDVVTSSDPTGPSTAWTTTDVDGDEQINDVSCPTSGFCAAVDDAGDVLTSTNPRRGPWTRMNVDGATPIDAIDCPRSTFCVAVDYAGKILVSTAPTASRWTIRRVDPGHELLAVSCVSMTLCVVGDDAGGILTSTVPANTNIAWTRAKLGTAAINSVSCASTEMCVAVDEDAKEHNSVEPAGGRRDWTHEPHDAVVVARVGSVVSCCLVLRGHR